MENADLKKSSLDPDRWVVVAKLIRPHGFPREGVFRYRAQFDMRGSESLVGAKRVGLSPLGFDDREPQNQSLLEHFKVDFIEVPLHEEASPLGGKWSQAEGALLSFSEKAIPQGEAPHVEKEWVGRLVALRRRDFPRIDQTEVYLCDLVGFEVRASATSPALGWVYAYAQIPKSAQFNIVVKTSVDGEEFEFPMKWIDWTESQIEKSFLVVPSVEEWRSL